MSSTLAALFQYRFNKARAERNGSLDRHPVNKVTDNEAILPTSPSKLASDLSASGVDNDEQFTSTSQSPTGCRSAVPVGSASTSNHEHARATASTSNYEQARATKAASGKGKAQRGNDKKVERGSACKTGNVGRGRDVQSGNDQKVERGSACKTGNVGRGRDVQSGNDKNVERGSACKTGNVGREVQSGNVKTVKRCCKSKCSNLNEGKPGTNGGTNGETSELVDTVADIRLAGISDGESTDNNWQSNITITSDSSDSEGSIIILSPGRYRKSELIGNSPTKTSKLRISCQARSGKNQDGRKANSKERQEVFKNTTLDSDKSSGKKHKERPEILKHSAVDSDKSSSKKHKERPEVLKHSAVDRDKTLDKKQKERPEVLKHSAVDRDKTLDKKQKERPEVLKHSAMDRDKTLGKKHGLTGTNKERKIKDSSQSRKPVVRSESCDSIVADVSDRNVPIQSKSKNLSKQKESTSLERKNGCRSKSRDRKIGGKSQETASATDGLQSYATAGELAMKDNGNDINTRPISMDKNIKKSKGLKEVGMKRGKSLDREHYRRSRSRERKIVGRVHVTNTSTVVLNEMDDNVRLTRSKSLERGVCRRAESIEQSPPKFNIVLNLHPDASPQGGKESSTGGPMKVENIPKRPRGRSRERRARGKSQDKGVRGGSGSGSSAMTVKSNVEECRRSTRTKSCERDHSGKILELVETPNSKMKIVLSSSGGLETVKKKQDISLQHNHRSRSKSRERNVKGKVQDFKMSHLDSFQNSRHESSDLSLKHITDMNKLSKGIKRKRNKSVSEEQISRSVSSERKPSVSSPGKAVVVKTDSSDSAINDSCNNIDLGVKEPKGRSSGKRTRAKSVDRDVTSRTDSVDYSGSEQIYEMSSSKHIKSKAKPVGKMVRKSQSVEKGHVSRGGSRDKMTRSKSQDRHVRTKTDFIDSAEAGVSRTSSLKGSNRTVELVEDCPSKIRIVMKDVNSVNGNTDEEVAGRKGPAQRPAESGVCNRRKLESESEWSDAEGADKSKRSRSRGRKISKARAPVEAKRPSESGVCDGQKVEPTSELSNTDGKGKSKRSSSRGRKRSDAQVVVEDKRQAESGVCNRRNLESESEWSDAEGADKSKRSRSRSRKISKARAPGEDKRQAESGVCDRRKVESESEWSDAEGGDKSKRSRSRGRKRSKAQHRQRHQKAGQQLDYSLVHQQCDMTLESESEWSEIDSSDTSRSRLQDDEPSPVQHNHTTDDSESCNIHKQFRCNICGNSYMSMDLLELHVYIHFTYFHDYLAFLPTIRGAMSSDTQRECCKHCTPGVKGILKNVVKKKSVHFGSYIGNQAETIQSAKSPEVDHISMQYENQTPRRSSSHKNKIKRKNGSSSNSLPVSVPQFDEGMEKLDEDKDNELQTSVSIPHQDSDLEEVPTTDISSSNCIKRNTTNPRHDDDHSNSKTQALFELCKKRELKICLVRLSLEHCSNKEMIHFDTTQENIIETLPAAKTFAVQSLEECNTSQNTDRLQEESTEQIVIRKNAETNDVEISGLETVKTLAKRQVLENTSEKCTGPLSSETVTFASKQKKRKRTKSVKLQVKRQKLEEIVSAEVQTIRNEMAVEGKTSTISHAKNNPSTENDSQHSSAVLVVQRVESDDRDVIVVTKESHYVPMKTAAKNIHRTSKGKSIFRKKCVYGNGNVSKKNDLKGNLILNGPKGHPRKTSCERPDIGTITTLPKLSKLVADGAIDTNTREQSSVGETQCVKTTSAENPDAATEDGTDLTLNKNVGMKENLDTTDETKSESDNKIIHSKVDKRKTSSKKSELRKKCVYSSGNVSVKKDLKGNLIFNGPKRPRGRPRKTSCERPDIDTSTTLPKLIELVVNEALDTNANEQNSVGETNCVKTASAENPGTATDVGVQVMSSGDSFVGIGTEARKNCMRETFFSETKNLEEQIERERSMKRARKLLKLEKDHGQPIKSNERFDMGEDKIDLGMKSSNEKVENMIEANTVAVHEKESFDIGSKCIDDTQDVENIKKEKNIEFIKDVSDLDIKHDIKDNCGTFTIGDILKDKAMLGFDIKVNSDISGLSLANVFTGKNAHVLKEVDNDDLNEEIFKTIAIVSDAKPERVQCNALNCNDIVLDQKSNRDSVTTPEDDANVVPMYYDDKARNDVVDGFVPGESDAVAMDNGNDANEIVILYSPDDKTIRCDTPCRTAGVPVKAALKLLQCQSCNRRYKTLEGLQKHWVETGHRNDTISPVTDHVGMGKTYVVLSKKLSLKGSGVTEPEDGPFCENENDNPGIDAMPDNKSNHFEIISEDESVKSDMGEEPINSVLIASPLPVNRVPKLFLQKVPMSNFSDNGVKATLCGSPVSPYWKIKHPTKADSSTPDIDTKEQVGAIEANSLKTNDDIKCNLRENSVNKCEAEVKQKDKEKDETSDVLSALGDGSRKSKKRKVEKSSKKEKHSKKTERSKISELTDFEKALLPDESREKKEIVSKHKSKKKRQFTRQLSHDSDLTESSKTFVKKERVKSHVTPSGHFKLSKTAQRIFLNDQKKRMTSTWNDGLPDFSAPVLSSKEALPILSFKDPTDKPNSVSLPVKVDAPSNSVIGDPASPKVGRLSPLKFTMPTFSNCREQKSLGDRHATLVDWNDSGSESLSRPPHSNKEDLELLNRPDFKVAPHSNKEDLESLNRPDFILSSTPILGGYATVGHRTENLSLLSSAFSSPVKRSRIKRLPVPDEYSEKESDVSTDINPCGTLASISCSITDSMDLNPTLSESQMNWYNDQMGLDEKDTENPLTNLTKQIVTDPDELWKDDPTLADAPDMSAEDELLLNDTAVRESHLATFAVLDDVLSLEEDLEGSERTPEDNGSKRTPENNGSERVPEDNGSVRMPEDNGSERTPEGNGSERTPEDNCERTPENNGSERMPEDNSSVRTPEDNGSERTPEDNIVDDMDIENVLSQDWEEDAKMQADLEDEENVSTVEDKDGEGCENIEADTFEDGDTVSTAGADGQGCEETQEDGGNTPLLEDGGNTPLLEDEESSEKMQTDDMGEEGEHVNSEITDKCKTNQSCHIDFVTDDVVDIFASDEECSFLDEDSQTEEVMSRPASRSSGIVEDSPRCEPQLDAAVTKEEERVGSRGDDLTPVQMDVCTDSPSESGDATNVDEEIVKTNIPKIQELYLGGKLDMALAILQSHRCLLMSVSRKDVLSLFEMCCKQDKMDHCHELFWLMKERKLTIPPWVMEDLVRMYSKSPQQNGEKMALVFFVAQELKTKLKGDIILIMLQTFVGMNAFNYVFQVIQHNSGKDHSNILNILKNANKELLNSLYSVLLRYHKLDLAAAIQRLAPPSAASHSIPPQTSGLHSSQNAGGHLTAIPPRPYTPPPATFVDATPASPGVERLRCSTPSLLASWEDDGEDGSEERNDELDTESWIQYIKSVPLTDSWDYLGELYVDHSCRVGRVELCYLHHFVNAMIKENCVVKEAWEKFMMGVVTAVKHRQDEGLPSSLDRQSLSHIGNELFHVCCYRKLASQAVQVLYVMDNYGIMLLHSPFHLHQDMPLLAVRACIQEQHSLFALKILKAVSVNQMDVRMLPELISWLPELLRQLDQSTNSLTDCCDVLEVAFAIMCSESQPLQIRERDFPRPSICSTLVLKCLQTRDFATAKRIYALHVQYRVAFVINPVLQRAMLCAFSENQCIVERQELFSYLKMRTPLYPACSLAPPRVIVLHWFYADAEMEVVIKDYIKGLYNRFCDQTLENITLTERDQELMIRIDVRPEIPHRQEAGMPYLPMRMSLAAVMKRLSGVLEKLVPPLSCQQIDQQTVTVIPHTLDTHLKYLDKGGRWQGLTFKSAGPSMSSRLGYGTRGRGRQNGRWNRGKKPFPPHT